MLTKPSFNVYFTAGDGGLEYSLEAALALEQGGADVFEIGVPFSDPVADGPVIQAAMQRSLKQGTTLSGVLELIRKIRQYSKIPIVLFSYYNPIYQAGTQFFSEAKSAGANAFLIPDVPFENRICQEQVFLATPSTSSKRLEQIAQQSYGFIYYACRKGTTGVKTNIPEYVKEDVVKIKKMTNTPVVVGFGISTRDQAAEILNYADGFVVGSVIVKAMGNQATSKELMSLARSINPY